jgi:chemotaxis protein methyltransferase CheR
MSSNSPRLTLRVPAGIDLLLRNLIHEQMGIFFEDSRTDLLLEKLEPLALSRSCHSFLDYYYLLKDNDLPEWDAAWSALSVHETYFWRELSQIQALAGIIAPEWFKKSKMPLRIWSAACASGEEPYTIAIALAEAGFGSHPVEIIGTDANPLALKKAAEGIYRERSFRSLPDHLRQKYFTAASEGSKILPAIAKKVSFRRANLVETGAVASLSRAHVIFCRNVFIYFSPHSIRQTVAIMASRMASGGNLFIGASESLLRMTTDFELKEIGSALVYQRI